MEYELDINEAKKVKRRAERENWRVLSERLGKDLRVNRLLIYGLTKSYGKNKSKINSINSA